MRARDWAPATAASSRTLGAARRLFSASIDLWPNPAGGPYNPNSETANARAPTEPTACLLVALPLPPPLLLLLLPPPPPTLLSSRAAVSALFGPWPQRRLERRLSLSAFAFMPLLLPGRLCCCLRDDPAPVRGLHLACLLSLGLARGGRLASCISLFVALSLLVLACWLHASAVALSAYLRAMPARCFG